MFSLFTSPTPFAADPASDEESIGRCPPLGEIGGALFFPPTVGEEAHSHHHHHPHNSTTSSQYQIAGGAVYRPLHFSESYVKPNYSSSPSSSSRALRRSLWSTVERCTAAVLRPIANWVPLVRLVTPNPPPISPHRVHASSSDGMPAPADHVTAIAFHYHLPVVAVSIQDEQSARIVLYDYSTEALLPLHLTSPFQSAIEALAWKPASRDVLLVGCKGGVLVWHLSFQRKASSVLNSNAAAAAAHQGGAPILTSSSAHRHIVEEEWGDGRSAVSVFYQASGASEHLITSLACSHHGGKYLAMASRTDPLVSLVDLSKPPRASHLYHASHLTSGGVSGVLFSQNDRMLITAWDASTTLRVTTLPSFELSHFTVPQPIRQMSPAEHLRKRTLSDSGEAMEEEVLVVSYAATEGCAIISVTQKRLAVLALISTGMRRGVGGVVDQLHVHGARLYLQVRSGHWVMAHVGAGGGRSENHSRSAVGSSSLVVRRIGVFQQRQSSSYSSNGPSVFALSPNAPHGSLAALWDGCSISWIPSYYDL